jgi:hypothetical protein
VKAGEIGHEVVVYPEATHSIMDSRINLHRLLVRVIAGDFLIHLEEVSVAGPDSIFTVTFDSVLEVKEDPESSGSYPASFVAAFLSSPGSNIAWAEVTKRRILSLEIVITLILGYVSASLFTFADGLGVLR